MKTVNSEDVLFAITTIDIQDEAMEKLGRELTQEELLVAKKGLESAFLTDIDTIYRTIFTEMIGK